METCAYKHLLAPVTCGVGACSHAPTGWMTESAHAPYAHIHTGAWEHAPTRRRRLISSVCSDLLFRKKESR